MARQGYVNLAPAGSPDGDDAAMVAARAEFLAGGWFDPLSRRRWPRAAAESAAPGAVAELGAGTGHHLAAVLDALDDDRAGVALDASVYAARRAARAHPRVTSVVADAWGRLPLLDGSVGLALVVFAPRAGAEIARVLAPGAARWWPWSPPSATWPSWPGRWACWTWTRPRTSACTARWSRSSSRSTPATWSGRWRWTARRRRRWRPWARRRATSDPGELRARIEALPEPVGVTGAVSLSRWRAAA